MSSNPVWTFSRIGQYLNVIYKLLAMNVASYKGPSTNTWTNLDEYNTKKSYVQGLNNNGFET